MRIVALGGLGEVGRNMAVIEHGGQLLVIDCGVLFPEDHHPGVDLILPDFDYIEDRLDDMQAIVLTHGHEDHIGAVPYLLRLKPDIPLVGSHAHPGPGRGQAARAPDHPLHPGRQGGDAREARRLRLRVRRRQPLDPRRARGLRPDPGGHDPAHRRLQDGPAAARRPAHRPARLRPAGGGGRRPVHDRLDQRRGPGLHHAREGHRARDRQGVPRTRSAGSSSPASPPTCTASSRCSTPPRRPGARSPWSGAPWSATWASPPTSATSTCPTACSSTSSGSTTSPTTRSSSCARAPRASRWRRCRAWPTATTGSTSARATPSSWRPRSSPATRTPSTASSTA